MKTTNEIINEIKTANDYSPTDNRSLININDFLKEILHDVNTRQMFIILDIDLTNGYKYIRGDRNINRDQFLKILIYLKYDLETIQRLLKNFNFPILYAKSKRDAAIIYSIFNKYTYNETKSYLKENNITLL